jgi:hypothetical protein
MYVDVPSFSLMFSTKSGISARSCSALASSLPMSMSTQQIANTENSKQIFPEKELRGHSPNFNIHVSVITIDLPILLQEISGPILGIYKSLTDT